MAILGKKNTNSTKIPELQDYYANQKNESTGVAWLLAVGSLLVTVAIFVGLFAGGRWLYRKATDNDNKITTTTQTTDTTVNEDGSTAVTVTTPSPNQPIAKVTVPTTTPAQGVTPAQSIQKNAAAVAASTSIPDTGPNLPITLFLVILLSSAYIHRTYTIRKNS